MNTLHRIRRTLAPPVQPRPLTWSDHLVALFAGLASLVVYILTLAPTLSGEDSGELIAAADELGIAHPPGYPIWCLVTHLFIRILPFSDVAYCANMASAVLAAAAVACLTLIIIKLLDSRAAALAGALAFAFSKDHWGQSVIAEVYSLNTLFVLSLILLLLVWRETQRLLWLSCFSLTLGLSLTNHHTAALLTPLFVAFILLVSPELLRRKRLIGGQILLLLLGLSVYLYLPLRAATDPYVNWGDPRSWDAMVDHITRAQYKTAAAQVAPRTLEKVTAQLGILWMHLSDQFTLWLLPVIAWGSALLFRKQRLVFCLLLAIAIACTLGIVYYTNFDIEPEDIYANRVFFIPAYACFSVCLAASVAWLLGWLKQQPLRLAQAAAAAAVLLAAGPPLLAYYHESDKSDYYFAHDFGLNLLASLEENAIVFPSADHTTFPLVYLLKVEGRRPDVINADKYGYIEPDLYTDMPPKVLAAMATLSGEPKRHFIQDYIIRKYSDRPVYFTLKRDLSTLPGHELVPAGVTFRLIRPAAELEALTELDQLFQPETLPNREIWSRYRMRNERSGDVALDFTAEIVLNEYSYARGWMALREGDVETAVQHFGSVDAKLSDLRSTLNNIGGALAEFERYDDARVFFQRALSRDPGYQTARKNLATTYMSESQYTEAKRIYDKAIEADATDSLSYLRRGLCNKGLGLFAEAIRDFRLAAACTPESARPYEEMAVVFLENLQANRQAWYAARDAIRRAPGDRNLRALLRRIETEASTPPEVPELRPHVPEIDLPDVPGLPRLPDPLQGLQNREQLIPLPAAPRPEGGLPLEGGSVRVPDLKVPNTKKPDR